jgi:hypothetical protein
MGTSLPATTTILILTLLILFESINLVVTASSSIWSASVRRLAFQPIYENVDRSLSLQQQELLILSRIGRGGSALFKDEVDAVDDSNEDDEEEDEVDDEEEEEVEWDTTIKIDNNINSDMEDDEEDDDEENEDEKVATATTKGTTTANTEYVKFDATLAAAALKSVTKTKVKVAQQHTATVKQAVNTKLTSTTNTNNKSKKSGTTQIYKRIPYIIRAVLNPFTFIAMTKSYWSSLFNLNYLQQYQQASDGGITLLRSAQEEKNKRTVSLPSSSSNNKRSKRTMKRGQAKTLNDLPKLSS